MKRIKLALSLILLLGVTSIYSQNMGLFSKEEWDKANTASNKAYMSDEEKEVIRYMNLARMDGKKFFDSFAQTYLEMYNSIFAPKIEGNNKYLISLKDDLYKINGLSIIYPNEKLYRAAEYHANDMGKNGLTGHNSSDGNSYSKRMLRLLGTEYYLSENCSYGLDKGFDIVFQLLLDNDVPSLGHRTNILNPEQKYVGVNIKKHKTWDYNCVIDFYCNSDTASFK